MMIFVVNDGFFFFTADELQEGSTTDKNYIALKIDRSAKHIQWLKKNQKLLTILLNYCSLHGASGGDLAGSSLLLFVFIGLLMVSFTHII